MAKSPKKVSKKGSKKVKSSSRKGSRPKTAKGAKKGTKKGVKKGTKKGAKKGASKKKSATKSKSRTPKTAAKKTTPSKPAKKVKREKKSKGGRSQSKISLVRSSVTDPVPGTIYISQHVAWHDFEAPLLFFQVTRARHWYIENPNSQTLSQVQPGNRVSLQVVHGRPISHIHGSEAAQNHWPVRLL